MVMVMGTDNQQHLELEKMSINNSNVEPQAQVTVLINEVENSKDLIATDFQNYEDEIAEKLAAMRDEMDAAREKFDDRMDALLNKVNAQNAVIRDELDELHIRIKRLKDSEEGKVILNAVLP